jgi:hypothetical protein
MPSPPRLCDFEALEDRSLPSTFHIPWADPNHLTLSFAADGTGTPLGANSLSATLAQTGGTTAEWQRVILRAFQTWAANANIDIGLVADGGQAFGALGAVQGDRRFGDIRVGAAPLSPKVVSNTSPFSWTGTTFSGDMILNSRHSYSLAGQPGAFDLFTVALHEAGHSFGLPDQSTDPTSVMWAWYEGLVNQLAPADLQALQALYGVRAPDAFDASGSNGTRATADTIPQVPGSGQRLATGDLTTQSDVDYYKFNVPALLPMLSSVVVRLKASGISLLTAKVTVYDCFGRVVTSAVTTDPLNNDLMLNFRPGLFGGTYYVKVAGAGNGVFDVGGYKLAVDYLSLGGVLAPLTSTVGAILDGGTNDVLGSALGIAPPPASDSRFDAIYRGVIEDRQDVDYYKIGTNQFAPGTPVTLDVMVWALDANALDPRIRMFDSAGNPVAFQVLANDGGLFSLQIPNAAAGEYYVQVAARDPGGANDTGSYFLAADFNRSAPIVYDGVASGAVQQGVTETDALTIPDAGLFQFALAANSAVPGSSVTMTVFDASGAVVFSLTAFAGKPTVTAVHYLWAGTYTVQYSTSSGTPVNFGMFILILSDEVGTYSTTTASPPPEGGSGENLDPNDPNGTTMQGGSSYEYCESSSECPPEYGYTF